MAAECRRQSVAWAKEIYRSGLSVILGKDATVAALGHGDSGPGLGHVRHHLFPTKLVGVMLRQRHALVAVFTARHFERQLIHVANEPVDRKNRYHQWREPCSPREQQDNDG